MPRKEWEPIIQQIVDELNREPVEASKSRLLVAARARLEKEPPHLLPYQIDQIVREVRRRVDAAGLATSATNATPNPV